MRSSDLPIVPIDWMQSTEQALGISGMRDLFAATYAFSINQSLSVYRLQESAVCKGSFRPVAKSILDTINGTK